MILLIYCYRCFDTFYYFAECLLLVLTLVSSFFECAIPIKIFTSEGQEVGEKATYR